MKIPFRLLTLALCARTAVAAEPTSSLLWSKDRQGDVVIYSATKASQETSKRKSNKSKPQNVQTDSPGILGIRINCKNNMAILTGPDSSVRFKIEDGFVTDIPKNADLSGDAAKKIIDALACDQNSEPDDKKVEALLPALRSQYPAVAARLGSGK